MGQDEKPIISEAERHLPEAAKRALAEARARREARESAAAGENATAEEIGGPKGEEPTRFGDWERAGRCVDF